MGRHLDGVPSASIGCTPVLWRNGLHRYVVAPYCIQKAPLGRPGLRHVRHVQLLDVKGLLALGVWNDSCFQSPVVFLATTSIFDTFVACEVEPRRPKLGDGSVPCFIFHPPMCHLYPYVINARGLITSLSVGRLVRNGLLGEEWP